MAMRKSLIFMSYPLLFSTLLIGLTLSSCLPVTSVPSPYPSPTYTAILAFTFSPTPLPPTSTPPLLPSETPTETPTISPTDPPTATTILFSYFFPIQPPGVANFAEGTSSHGYPATDIFAPIGAKFIAVTDGKVDFVSYKDTWDPVHDDPATRGGLSVAFIGDDGVRYYGSHLSTIANGIKPGVRVKVGQLLGLVGISGDARNTESHLHFGISRPTTPDDWKARRGQVDPFPFLQAWKDGHNITPPLPTP